jgi:uncharacterized protein (TIGR02001 family)
VFPSVTPLFEFYYRITERELQQPTQPINKMRNYSKLIGALAAVSALAAGNASAIDLNYNLHAGYTSEYIFRGVNLGNDLVEAGFDASAEVGAGLTVSAGVWYANFDSTSIFGTEANQNEIDLYAKVSKDLGFATASVGYIYYYNDNSNDIRDFFFGKQDDAQEVSFGLAREFYGVNVGLTYYWDIVLDNDGYAELTASKSFELNSCLTLNVGAALGYLVEEGHLAHLTTKVSLDYEFVENARLSPFIAGAVDLSGGHGNAYAAAKNELVGGAMIGVDF